MPIIPYGKARQHNYAYPIQRYSLTHGKALLRSTRTGE
jgi:hypothetical protein